MISSSKALTALITGGSSGIGYAIACEFASRGYRLILVSNQEERLKDVAQEIKATFNTEIHTLFMDLATPVAAAQLYEWCCNKQLEVDVLVNNAGFFHFGEVVETDTAKAVNMMTLHVSTPAMLCTFFGKEMKRRRSGNIIIISSLASYMPYPGIALYSATKRFLKNFSRSLRTEMLDYNVNVTCICPGAVSTDLYDLNDDMRKFAIRSGIMMRPEKLARKVVRSMNCRKSILIPGIINRIFLPFLFLIPHGIIIMIMRLIKIWPQDKK